MLIVLPGGYALRLIARRRFNLGTLLALPVVAGVFLSAALVPARPTTIFARSRETGNRVRPDAPVAGHLIDWFAVGTPPVAGSESRSGFALVPLSTPSPAEPCFLRPAQAPLQPEEI